MSAKVIIFDFFGVICSEVAPFWFQKYISKKEVQKYKKFYFEPADSVEISDDKLLENLSRFSDETAKKVKGELYNLVKINYDVVKIIKNLKQNHKIGICSNSNSKFLYTILQANELINLFDSIIISSEYGVTKPDVRIYKFALEQLSASPQETIFIDDNPKNIQGAEQVGIKSILFTNPKELVIELLKSTDIITN